MAPSRSGTSRPRIGCGRGLTGRGLPVAPSFVLSTFSSTNAAARSKIFPGSPCRDLTAQERLQPPQLVVGLLADGELNPVALRSRDLDDRTRRGDERGGAIAGAGPQGWSARGARCVITRHTARPHARRAPAMSWGKDCVLTNDRGAVRAEDQLRLLVLVVAPAAQGDVVDRGRTLFRVGLDVVKLQELPLRAPTPVH
jgi:hypothetical protein